MSDSLLYETLIPGLSVITISFLCAEFIGRSKHIGRNFTFLMMLGIIPGIIGLMFSPSSKKLPTKQNSAYYYLGIFLVIASISTIFSDIENITYIQVFVSISFVSSAIYCFTLSEGKVVNRTPRYYFEKTLAQGSQFEKAGKVKKNLESSIESLTNLRNKGIITDDFYYEKVAKIKSEKLREELQNSLEYKQLYGLFSSGILTKDEFENKVNLIEVYPLFEGVIEINENSFVGAFDVNGDTFSFSSDHILTIIHKSSRISNGFWYINENRSLNIKIGNIDAIFKDILFDSNGFSYVHGKTKFYANRIR